MVRSKNSLVDQALSKEDAERFYTEEDRNTWYRRALETILEHEQKRLAKEEEMMYTQGKVDEVVQSVSFRSALSKVSSLLRTNRIQNRGDSA